jgi:hypothetical protein
MYDIGNPVGSHNMNTAVIIAVEKIYGVFGIPHPSKL